MDMKRGKRTCEILKDVRRKVAQENGIPLVERECTHEGDCRGTCPYCESEVRYLLPVASALRAAGGHRRLLHDDGRVPQPEDTGTGYRQRT